MKADAVVLGAGMVGGSCALHLQARGRSVVLVDRRGAAERFGAAAITSPRRCGSGSRRRASRSHTAHW